MCFLFLHKSLYRDEQCCKHYFQCNQDLENDVTKKHHFKYSSAFETDFGWVLAGEVSLVATPLLLLAHHATVDTGDKLLRKFWEIEQQPSEYSSLFPEERSMMQQF